MVNRQVRYNVKSDSGEQIPLRHRWTVAIVNEPREIDRIESRFFRQLSPVEDVRELGDYSIPGSNGLHVKVVSFSSGFGMMLNPSEIYKSKKIRRDRDLWERDEEGLVRYVGRFEVE